uniref:Mos1 transposase HTH domain-containing protein n=1 Tax=Latimeria chalumnae TaxID=7897 RepID=H2ZS50_LATCH
STYGDGVPHYSTVAKWYSEFKCGCESLEDDPQSGRPADMVTPETIAQVEALIMQDCHIKIDAIVTELGISHVVTGDEMWIHIWDPETKCESMQWKHRASPPPKKFRSQPSASKVMAPIFWDAKGVLLTDYMPHKTRMTGEYYASLMWKLRQAIKEKRQGMLTKGVLLLHDNVPVHNACVAQAAIHECGFKQLNHPPYSPDLAPSDYLEAYLCGKRFSNDEELMEVTEAWLQDTSQKYFAGIDSLQDKWSKCIEVKGDYIEK